MTDVLVVAHHERIDASALARLAASWLVENGHTAWMMPEDAEPLCLFALILILVVYHPPPGAAARAAGGSTWWNPPDWP